jgi:putative transposase
LDTHPRASLATAALRIATEARRPQPDTLIHHSDRGVAYAFVQELVGEASHPSEHEPHRQSLRQYQAENSMSTLKQEEVDAPDDRDPIEIRAAIGIFIKKVSNR